MEEKRMRIYVAGPYTKGNVTENVRYAIHEGDYIARLGHIPFIPHLSHWWEQEIHHPVEFWYEQDMYWLELCDAVLRIPGESIGADKEVEYAREHGMTIYKSVFEIPKAGNSEI